MIAPWKLAVLLLVVLVVALFFGTRLVAHRLIDDLPNQVHQKCKTCNLKIGSWNFRLFPFQLDLKGIEFEGGTKGAFEVQAKATRVTVAFDLLALAKKRLSLSDLRVDNLAVILIDGDSKSPPSKAKEEKESLEYLISNTEVHHAKLTYVRNHMGTHALLNIRDIDLKVEAIGSIEDLADLPVLARASGQIEESGWVTVSVDAEKRKPLHVDVRVEAKGQKLDELTPFFKENAGVELQGTLVLAYADVAVRGSASTSKVRAEYEGLKVHLDKMYDRNEITAFFMSLGTQIAMVRSNRNQPTYVQERSVQSKREDGESIVGFILRGLKEAAIHVTEARRVVGFN